MNVESMFDAIVGHIFVGNEHYEWKVFDILSEFSS